ncbi:hypothetical protein ACMFMF_007733 [Clarireedia jacksonii]
MVGVKVLSPSYRPALPTSSSAFLPPTPPTTSRDPGILFQQRRPVLMRYESRVVGLASRIINLPWVEARERLNKGRDDESRGCDVSAGERQCAVCGGSVGREGRGTGLWDEGRGTGEVKRVAMVDVELESRECGGGSGDVLGIGDVRGACCVGGAEIGVWWGGGRGDGEGKRLDGRGDMDDDDEVEREKVKEEATDDEPDISDTPRTFPTTGRQMPLVYPPVGIKKEEDEEESKVLEETVILPLGGDADDEDEDGEESWKVEGRRSDSGLGTSFSEAGSSRPGRVTRRKSRGGSGSGL